jgi:hypothetical protein
MPKVSREPEDISRININPPLCLPVLAHDSEGVSVCAYLSAVEIKYCTFQIVSGIHNNKYVAKEEDIHALCFHTVIPSLLRVLVVGFLMVE